MLENKEIIRNLKKNQAREREIIHSTVCVITSVFNCLNDKFMKPYRIKNREIEIKKNE